MHADSLQQLRLVRCSTAQRTVSAAEARGRCTRTSATFVVLAIEERLRIGVPLIVRKVQANTPWTAERVVNAARIKRCQHVAYVHLQHACLRRYPDGGARAYTYSPDVVHQEIWLSLLTACGDFGAGPDTGGIERTWSPINFREPVASWPPLLSLNKSSRTGSVTSSFVGLGSIRPAACDSMSSVYLVSDNTS